MRIMCVFANLTVILVLSFGCSAEVEKRERAEPGVKKVKPEARKPKPLPKKVEPKKPKYAFPTLNNIQKQLLKSLGLMHLTEEQARELFKKVMPLIKKMHNLEKQIQKYMARADALDRQSNAELSKVERKRNSILRQLKKFNSTLRQFKAKKIDLVRRRRLRLRQLEAQFLATKQRLKAVDKKMMEATELQIKALLLHFSLDSLAEQVDKIRATYRKKKRSMRSNP